MIGICMCKGSAEVLHLFFFSRPVFLSFVFSMPSSLLFVEKFIFLLFDDQ